MTLKWLLIGVFLPAVQLVSAQEDAAVAQLSKDLSALRNEVRAMMVVGEDDLPRAEMKALAKKWSKKNARALFEWTAGDSGLLLDSDDHESFYRHVGIQFALQYPQEALDFIDRKFRLMRSGDDESGDALLIESILKVVLFADSEGVVKWMEADADRVLLLSLLDDNARGLFMKYAPAYVMNIAEAEKSDAFEYVTIAFTNLAATDWKAATERISFWNFDKEEELMERGIYGEMVRSLARNFPEKEPEIALEWLKQIDEEVAEAVRILVKGEQAPDKILAFLRESIGIDGQELDGLYYELFSKCVYEEPASTMAWVARLPEGPSKDRAIQLGVGRWMRKDPQAAMAWTESLADTRTKSHALEALVSAWPSVNSKAAGEWIEKLPAGRLKAKGAEAMFNVLSSGRTRNYETALKWAEQLQGSDFALDMRLEMMFMRWASRSPGSAVEAMKNSALSEERQQRILQMINKRTGGNAARARGGNLAGRREIMEEVRTDPTAAMKLIEQLEGGSDKEMMQQIAQFQLDQADPKGALNRVKAMQDGEAKVGRLRMLVRAATRSGDYAAAFEAAEQMENRWKEGLLDQVFKGWLKASPKVALEALEKSSFSEEKKEFYRKAFSPN